MKQMEEIRVEDKVIQVLMSTYNGEKYLREQLDSILEQDTVEKHGVKLKILIRDDGSKDGTQKILDEYSNNYPEQIKWYQGNNKGVINSFFELVEESDNKASYYAFSDQDDYWHKDKLSAGIGIIDKMAVDSGNSIDNMPFLYCCSPLLVDENLNEIDNKMTRRPKLAQFENAVIENIVTGCTIIMNKGLRDMAKSHPPKFTVMHDWWFYLLASCYGKVYYDQKQYISYRQHGSNTVGYNTSKIKEFSGRVKRFKGNRQNITRQLEDFVRIYKLYLKENPENIIFKSDEVKNKIKIAYNLVKYSRKVKYLPKRVSMLGKAGIFRQRKIDNLIFKLILLSGSY